LILLNHQLLPLILNKAGFHFKVSLFFQDYLIGRKTKYYWNNFSFHHFNVDIGIRQGSALSSILLTLYLSPIFCIFKKRLKNLNIPISIIFFINNRLFISQDKSLIVSNSYLFCSYHIMFSFFEQFGFVIEHGKIEFFHFSRLYEAFNLLLLNLTTQKGPILYPKEIWYCLRFIFNRKLTFQQHINFYTYKAILTIKYMKMLVNSLRELIPNQKCLLYRTCILPIILYSFSLQYYNKASLAYPLRIKFSPRDRLIDIFPSYFLFYSLDHKNEKKK